MRVALGTCAVLLGLGLGALHPASAAVREVAPGVYYDDFKTGQFDQLGGEEQKARQPQKLAVLKDSGKDVLFLTGGFHSRVYFTDRRFRNCVVETRMKKGKGSYAGVVVRGNVFIYFQMSGALCLSEDNRGGSFFQSGEAFQGYHDLKVVCVGPVIRGYVDGKLVFTEQAPDKEGQVGFYSHGGGEGYYDSFRVSGHADPVEGILVKPTAPGDSLVVAPGTDGTLAVNATNYGDAAQTVSIRVAVTGWDGAAVGRESKRDIGLEAGKTAATAFELGRLPEGFYKIELLATCGGKEVARYDDLPLAVQERGKADFAPPVIPVAPYSKYTNRRDTLYQNTYAHAVGRLLREHRFNAVVADTSFTREMVGIFGSYGIATIARGGAFLDHPAVIATLASDEPKPDQIDALKAEYAKLSQSAGKPVTTCLVGEGLGLGGDHDPVVLWQRLDAKVRAFRWYGIKKSYYGTLYDLKYKGLLPLASVMRIAEATAETPWWFIPTSFGRTDHEAYFQNPSPAQMRGMMHLALAHGADGLMLWCLQSHDKWPAMIDQRSLQPLDGKLAAAGEVAARVAAHGDLLSKLRYGYFEVGNSNPLRIEAVPRRGPDGRAFVYAVNRDEYALASATLACRVGPGTDVKDLYAGKPHAARKAANGGWELDLTLAPGNGALLDLGAGLEAREPAALAAHPAPAAGLAPALAEAVRTAVTRDGAAVLRLALGDKPCMPGDGIGLLGSDDPRAAWGQTPAAPRCLSWTGRLQGRSAQGYLPLDSALWLAHAAAARASSDVPDVETKAKADKPNARFWVAYPAIAVNGATPGELRAMLHLAFACGAEAALVLDALPPELAAAADEVAQLLRAHGKTLAGLTSSGMDIRCKDPRVAAYPRQDAKGGVCVYAVNLDPVNPVTADLLLWGDDWNWTTARDLFAGADLPVKPRDAEGYLGCAITLKPGEGRLVAIGAEYKKK